MVGFEAVLHRDLAIVGLAVDIVVVTVGDGVARVLVLDGTGDGGLEKEVKRKLSEEECKNGCDV